MNPREAQLKGQNNLHSANTKTHIKLYNKRRKLEDQLDALQKRNQFTGKRRKNLNPIEAEKAKGLKSEIRKINSELNKIEDSNARIMGNPNAGKSRVGRRFDEPGGATRGRKPATSSTRTQPSPFQSRGATRSGPSFYNKGGYAKCGASNPPSKKR